MMFKICFNAVMAVKTQISFFISFFTKLNLNCVLKYYVFLIMLHQKQNKREVVLYIIMHNLFLHDNEIKFIYIFINHI